MAEDINKKEFDWISEVFKKKEVFTGLSYSEREALIEDMYKIRFKPEDIIFKEGDNPNACFLIYTGKVKVVKNKMLVLKKNVSTLGAAPSRSSGPGNCGTVKPRFSQAGPTAAATVPRRSSSSQTPLPSHS